MHGKKSSTGALFGPYWSFLWLTHGPMLAGGGRGPWVLLTPPQECVACEGAVFEAAGTATPLSEKGEHMQIQDE